MGRRDKRREKLMNADELATLPTFTRSRAELRTHSQLMRQVYVYFVCNNIQSVFVTLSDNKRLQQVVNWGFTGTRKVTNWFGFSQQFSGLVSASTAEQL